MKNNNEIIDDDANHGGPVDVYAKHAAIREVKKLRAIAAREERIARLEEKRVNGPPGFVEVSDWQPTILTDDAAMDLDAETRLLLRSLSLDPKNRLARQLSKVDYATHSQLIQKVLNEGPSRVYFDIIQGPSLQEMGNRSFLATIGHQLGVAFASIYEEIDALESRERELSEKLNELKKNPDVTWSSKISILATENDISCIQSLLAKVLESAGLFGHIAPIYSEKRGMGFDIKPRYLRNFPEANPVTIIRNYFTRATLQVYAEDRKQTETCIRLAIQPKLESLCFLEERS